MPRCSEDVYRTIFDSEKGKFFSICPAVEGWSLSFQFVPNNIDITEWCGGGGGGYFHGINGGFFLSLVNPELMMNQKIKARLTFLLIFYIFIHYNSPPLFNRTLGT